MEPKTIKQELETTKEDTSSEEAPTDFRTSSGVQNTSGHETRVTRNKGK